MNNGKRGNGKKPRLRDQSHGGALLTGGVPGHDGRRAGRPPNEWKRRMEGLRDRWLVAAEAATIVENVKHPQWLNLGKFLASYTAELPVRRIAFDLSTLNDRELDTLERLLQKTGAPMLPGDDGTGQQPTIH